MSRPTHTVVGQAKEYHLNDMIDVVEVRGVKPNRTIILYEPYNKPDRIYTRAVETQDPNMRQFFKYDGAFFAPDMNSPNGKWYGNAPNQI